MKTNTARPSKRGKNLFATPEEVVEKIADKLREEGTFRGYGEILVAAGLTPASHFGSREETT